jgi:hypothetical protein
MIVENQLEQADHSQMGHLLTYAGGTNLSTIVCCAPSFREVHRAALDWLNEHTEEDTRFFGSRSQLYASTTRGGCSAQSQCLGVGGRMEVDDTTAATGDR